jgi:hypothetical protein
MINCIERTYKAKGDGCNVVECSIYYSKGGMNWATGREEARGYWFSIQPFEVSGICRSFRAFSGTKTLVLPCERQSKKRYEAAKAQLDDLIQEYLERFCEENGIEVFTDEFETTEKEM